MGMESLYKLSVLVNMIDRISMPAARIGGVIDGTASKFQAYSSAMAGMSRDGVVLMGTGYQIATAAVAPVKATFATKDALSELSSLGIEKLGLLEDAATSFSNTWAGTTKPEFLTAAYDIKSGIASLNDEGVAGYTALAGVTAKATKSSISEMTNLFATGYGIYKDYYGNLSDLEFGEIFSSGISQSVKQFKTTGSGMTQAISALGATATSAKVPLEEQLTVLGMLQATMGGSEAGTKYTAFLNSAAKAGKEMGLNFLDASGQLKSMPEILGVMQGKFGDVLTAADKLELQKAFGTVEAVKLIDLLYGKTDDLQGNILTLYDTMGKGMSITEEMANKINAPPGQSWEVFKQTLQSTLETVGNAMTPRFVELQGAAGGALTKISEWVTKHPELTSAIMYSIAAFGTFIASLGVAKFAIGGIGGAISAGIKIYDVAKLGWRSLTGAIDTARLMMWGARDALAPLGRGFLTMAGNVKTALVGMLAWVKQGVMSAISAMPALISSVWSFTAALLANPITWIVVGIIALIAALVLLYQNWDSVTAFLGNAWNTVCSGISSGVAWVGARLSEFGAFFAGIPGAIMGALSSVGGKISGFFGGLWTQFRESGGKIITTFTDGIMAMVSKPIEAVKGVFQKIRNLMPFSDAKEGPLSELTLSGRRVFETFDAGMQQSAELPGQTAAQAFGATKAAIPAQAPPEVLTPPAYTGGAWSAAPTAWTPEVLTPPAYTGAAWNEDFPAWAADTPSDDGSAAKQKPHNAAKDGETRQNIRQLTIQQLVINLKMSDMDVKTWKQVKDLLWQLEDDANGDDPDGDTSDVDPLSAA